MSIEYFIMISSIFSKGNDLDILPPPPPFPEIGKEEKKILEPKIPKKKEEIRKGKEIDRKNKALMRKRLKTVKKKTFDFFHDVGLVRTEQEKKELVRQRREYKKYRELTKKNLLKRKLEEDKKRKLEMEKRDRDRKKEGRKIPKATDKILSRIEDRGLQKPERKTIFGKFFGKKEKTELDKVLEKQSFSGSSEIKNFRETGNAKHFPVRRKSDSFSRELEDLEILNVKEETKGKKLEIPEFKFPEIGKDEEEIQKAISGLKVKKISFIPKNLFKKKERVEKRIETPEVMPRTYDKIDYVEEIEEKMHKARLALMDFKFEEAKSVYIEIMRMYNKLESKKRSKIYQDIKDLYYERKSAERFAKK